MSMPLARRRNARSIVAFFGGAAVVSIGLLVTAAPAGAQDDSTYTVRWGDTLWGIAARHDVTVAELVSANAIADPEVVREGLRLVIPAGGSTADSDDDEPKASRDIRKATYVIKPGDTWTRIASRYSMRPAQLAEANGTTTAAVLYAGDDLIIPALDVGGIPPLATSTASYTVNAGDTLSGIAARYGTTARRLAEANGLELGGTLRIGVMLQVSGAPRGSSASASSNLPANIRNDPDRLALGPVFDAAAAEFGVPADLLKSVGYMESGWRPDVISYVGAMGVGQLMPDTAADLAVWMDEPDLDPWNPVDNVRMSAKYLQILLDLTGGDSDAALAAYYQGHWSVQNNGLYDDTRNYVSVIQGNRALFR